MSRRILIGAGIVLVVILAAGGGYVYGTSVGEQRARQMRTQAGQRRFGPQDGQLSPQAFQAGQSRQGQFGGPGGGGNVFGTIETIEGGKLVVNAGEQTVEVETTDTTLIEKYSSVEVSQLGTGDAVMVSGSPNDDGTITARSVRVVQRSQMPSAD